MCSHDKISSWRDKDYDMEDRAWIELIEKMSPARRDRLIALLMEMQRRVERIKQGK